MRDIKLKKYPFTTSQQILFIIFWVGSFFLFVFIVLKIPLPIFLKSFTSQFYFPNHNFCGVGRLADFNILKFFYALIALGMVLGTFVSFFFRRKLSSNFISSISLAGFLILLSFQTVNQASYFSTKKEIFSGATMDERKSLILGEAYLFAQFCQQHLTGRWGGKLVTDFDVMQTLQPYILIYHLYPTVNFFVKKESPKDCLIFFNKDKAMEYVPKDFEVIAVFNSRSLIAVKKGLPCLPCLPWWTGQGWTGQGRTDQGPSAIPGQGGG